MKPTLAVVGGGVAGLATAWLLRHHYEVTLLERNDYIGGHTHTIELPTDRGVVAVDTGFIVYNEPNYPLLTALFRHLGVETRESDMSFAVSIDQGRREYAGTNLNTLFAQRSNLLSPNFWGMIRDIVHFNRVAKEALAGDQLSGLTLRAFIEQQGLGESFQQDYLLPMAAAIWSCPTETMLSFPAQSFIQFFYNHGLINLTDRPQWRTVEGGSHSYVKVLLRDLPGRVISRAEVIEVQREPHQVSVTYKTPIGKQRQQFDQVVLASHADESLRMLANPTTDELRLLGAFNYQPNTAYLHTDVGLMPRRKSVWSSWNYMRQADRSTNRSAVSVTYWMNQLQGLKGSENYLVSLNPPTPPRSERVIEKMLYHHPVFTQKAMSAQTQLGQIQGRSRVWFCGSYFGYGFHEDALRSGVAVAQALGASLPWESSTPSQPTRIDAYRRAS